MTVFTKSKADVLDNEFTTIRFPATGGQFRLPPYTTAARDNLSLGTADEGFNIINTTTSKINFWNGSAWEAVTSA